MSKIYEIYPLPQNLKYRNESIQVPKEIKLETNFDLETGSLNRIKETLASQNSKLADEADFVLNISLDESLSEKFDYYTLEILNSEIKIQGNSKSSIFYGITTLYHIFKQAEAELELLKVEEYSEMKLRGMIEGYYGIPYTNAKRKSIMELGSYFKMNIYAFAPKNDPYHRDLWWKLYPEAELAEIADLAKFGEEHYNHYTWTIAPFKPDSNPITSENRDEGLDKIINKFGQLYEVGVRQFGVLGDDVGDLPYETVVYVMNKLNTWRKEKGDINDLIFCPQGYNMDDWAFRDGTEANIIDDGFDADIHIFYTGTTTCNVVSREAVDRWKTEKVDREGRVRRDPLFWMNWPVNDIDRDEWRRVFLGKGEVYEQGVSDMIGVLTNPMDEAEASKVALFATLDFGWNPNAFDADKSWADSFKYIEPEAAAELHEISKHMSNIRNGAKADAEESVELDEKVQVFKEAIDSGVQEKVLAAASDLHEAYVGIINAVDGFTNKSKNSQLLEELKAYNASLKDKAQIAALYLEVYMDYVKALLSQGEAEADKVKAVANHKIKRAKELIDNLKQHIVVTRTAEFPNRELVATAGQIVIEPNIEYLEELLK